MKRVSMNSASLKVQTHTQALVLSRRILQSVTAVWLKSEILKTDVINIRLTHVPIAVQDLLLLTLSHTTGIKPQWMNSPYAMTAWLSIEIPLTDVITERQYAAVTADPKWQFMKKMR